MKKRSGRLMRPAAAAVAFCMLMMLPGCAQPEPVVRSFPSMDTVFQVSFYGAEAKTCARQCKQISDRLERSFSISSEEGIPARTARAAAGEQVPLSEEEQAVLEKIHTFSLRTDGLFDVTVGGLKSLWEEGQRQQNVPDADEIQAALKLVGDTYTLTQTAIVPKMKGVSLDFGAVAKGYAADCLLAQMEQNGVEGFASLGGCIACRGKKPGGKPFRFGLKTPELGATDCFGTLTFLKDGVLSTSGDYERFYEIGNKRYSCILNPKTGLPAESVFDSVTVFGPDGMMTDMLSTYLMLLTPEEAFAAAHQAGCMAIAVGKDRVIYISEGLREWFVPGAGAKTYTLRYVKP